MDLIENCTDSEDELPEGFEERVTSYGKVYYANHLTKTTQWEHPKTRKEKFLTGDLPYGWERIVLDNGTILFVNHIEKKSSYIDPRLAYSKKKHLKKEEILINTKIDMNGYGGGGPRVRVVDSYVFDETSTASDLLRGRDLTGSYAIVTGANRGVGLEITKALAQAGCSVIMACRNMKAAQTACDSLQRDRPDLRLEVLELNLASLFSVRKFATKIIKRNIPINMLFLNAAVCETEYKLTEDDVEMMFQVNHLAQFYLARLLTQTLMTTPDSRLVIIACEAHRGGELSKFDISASKLNVTKSEFHFLQQYCNTKLCNVLFANEFNRRLNKRSSSNLMCKSCHPGNLLPTKLFENWTPHRCLTIFTARFAKLLAQAAASPILLATMEASYFDSKQCSPSMCYWNGLVPCDVSDEANDSVLAYRLWEISEAMIVERTNSFDSHLQRGDLFSSFSKSVDTETPESLSQSSSIEQVNGEHS